MSLIIELELDLNELVFKGGIDRIITEADWTTLYHSLIDSVIIELNILLYNGSRED